MWVIVKSLRIKHFWSTKNAKSRTESLERLNTVLRP